MALCQPRCTLCTLLNTPVYFVFTPADVLPFPSQMGGASSYSTQFLSHSGPRGPPGMVSSRAGPPPSTGGLYPAHPAQTQKMPQHGGYPGGQQGLKRPFHSEVSEVTNIRLFPSTGVVSSSDRKHTAHIYDNKNKYINVVVNYKNVNILLNFSCTSLHLKVNTRFY